MSDTYKAKLDNIDLDIETIEDSFEKSIAEQEIPYQDGALLEDLGQKARRVKFKCYFYNDTYETHKELLNHLEKKDLFELLHPKYGLFKGSVKTVAVKHDDRKETAEIDIEFVENLRQSIEPQYSPDVEAEVEEAYTAGQEEQMQEFSADMTDALGPEAGSILQKELNPALGIAAQFPSVSLTARRYLNSLDGYVNRLENHLSPVSNPTTSLQAMITYPATLPGRVIGALNLALERQVVSFEALRSSPYRFLFNLREAGQKLEDGGLFDRTIRRAAARRLALEAGYLYKADEEKRLKLRRLEKVRAFDTLGNYIKSEAPEAVLSVNELERTLADIRTVLQAAVDESRRDTQSLKDMALALLVHVNSIKLERDKIVKVNVDNPLPLHLVCLANDLPYSYAERINSINRIKNPNFTHGEISVYVR